MRDIDGAVGMREIGRVRGVLFRTRLRVRAHYAGERSELVQWQGVPERMFCTGTCSTGCICVCQKAARGGGGGTTDGDGIAEEDEAAAASD